LRIGSASKRLDKGRCGRLQPLPFVDIDYAVYHAEEAFPAARNRLAKAFVVGFGSSRLRGVQQDGNAMILSQSLMGEA
jgi:hypothetical protein